MKQISSENHSIRCVLFDLGGTLIYFDGDWHAVLAESVQALTRELLSAGLNLDAQTFAATFLQRLDAYYAERDSEFVQYTTHYLLVTLLEGLGIRDVPEDIFRRALRSMYAVSQAHWRAEQDAIHMLETLRAQGYRIGAVSNAGDDDDVQRLVDNAGLRPYFEVILVSAAVGIRKPNPRIFQMALEKLGCLPAETVMVGDTLGADVLGALNSGLASVWITRRADTRDNQAHEGTIQPDATIVSLSELPPLLADWPKRRDDR
jgi:2-haloalkanoic acid dehalogenase type II